MTSEDFLDSPVARAILERAQISAGTSLSVHVHEEGREASHALGLGHCDACAHVARHPWGKQTCRRSREPAARSALLHGRAAPFLCHMGFSCVSAGVTLDGVDVALTFGPYCPSEAPQALDDDVRRGLEALAREEVDDLPFALDDVPLVRAEALPLIAEWTAESLRAAYDASQPKQETPPAPVEAPPPSSSKAATRHVTKEPYDVTDVVTHLIAGNQDQARAAVYRLMAETGGSKRRAASAKRARLLGIVGAALEGAARGGVDIARCMEKYRDLPAAIEEASSERELARAAMNVLGQIKKTAKRNQEDQAWLAVLHQMVSERIGEPLTLNDVAKELGRHPTAITHRLKRNFGVSYSDYVGRIRVEKAKDLLRTTHLSVREVAQRVGISDASNLGRLFRKFEGLSPAAYREKMARKKA